MATKYRRTTIKTTKRKPARKTTTRKDTYHSKSAGGIITVGRKLVGGVQKALNDNYDINVWKMKKRGK